jgi:hypothetical protein
MSLQGIQDLDVDWTLRNQLTINNNVEVEGDLNTTGFIFDGGVPVNIQGTNNTWTGKNAYTGFLPTYLDPLANGEMATKNYLDGAVVGLGNGLLASANNWSAYNKMTGLPVITNNASVGTNELVNKAVVDGFIGSSTGSLGTNNAWSAVQTFSNVVSVPTPLTDPAFANKKYVDDSITAFNASGGKIEYVELLATGTLTCDPAVYSGCMICMVSSGGFGTNVNPPVITGANTKSFGGSGGFAVFKVPAFTGNATLTIINNTLTSVGSTSFTLPNLATIASIEGGTNGSGVASGTGGVFITGLPNIQKITGSQEPIQSPITNDAITKSYNIGVLNGAGNGGSFNYLTGTQVSPSGGYCLQIKYKN